MDPKPIIRDGIHWCSGTACPLFEHRPGVNVCVATTPASLINAVCGPSIRALGARLVEAEGMLHRKDTIERFLRGQVARLREQAGKCTCQPRIALDPDMMRVDAPGIPVTGLCLGCGAYVAADHGGPGGRGHTLTDVDAAGDPFPVACGPIYDADEIRVLAEAAALNRKVLALMELGLLVRMDGRHGYFVDWDRAGTDVRAALEGKHPEWPDNGCWKTREAAIEAMLVTLMAKGIIKETP